jgi:site-specific DNA recombinase
MKDVVAYVRVSTTRQGEQGVSLPEQRSAISEYAQRHALRITEWFEEQQSASKRGRPIFTRMLSMLVKRRTIGVIVHKVDRSSRNVSEWGDIEDLLDLGVDVFLAGEGLDLRSRGGRLAAGIKAVIAADYSRNLSDEVRKGFYGRLKQGVYPAPAPVGYSDQGPGKPKTPSDMGHLVREAFELYSSGEMSLRILTREMASRGLRNRYGRALRLTELAKLLHNSFYMGVIRIKKTGEVFEGKHEPLISPFLFRRVQDALSGRTVRGSCRHDFLFRRLFRCGQCRRSLIGERQKGRVYYRCHNPDCRKVSIREDVAERELLRLLGRLKFSDDEKVTLDRELQTLCAERNQQEDAAAKALSFRLQQVASRLDRLTDAYLDGAIEKEIFEARKMTLLTERREIEELRRAGSRSRTDILAQTLELANNACLLYENASMAEKRELIEIVSSNREVYDKTLVFTLVRAFAEIENRTRLQNGGPSRDSVRTRSTSKNRSNQNWRNFLRRLLAIATGGDVRLPPSFSRRQPSAA